MPKPFRALSRNHVPKTSLSRREHVRPTLTEIATALMLLGQYVRRERLQVARWDVSPTIAAPSAPPSVPSVRSPSVSR